MSRRNFGSIASSNAANVAGDQPADHRLPALLDRLIAHYGLLLDLRVHIERDQLAVQRRIMPPVIYGEPSEIASLTILAVPQLNLASWLASGIEHGNPLDKAHLRRSLTNERLDVSRHKVRLARLPAAKLMTGLHSHDFNFVLADRTIRIDVFPVGIETAAFADLSQRSVRLPFVKRVIKSLNGRPLIIGVDRLDYSKGIAHRLSAFELFLQTQPDWRGKVTYLQIAAESRTEIPEYADMEQEIGSAAGRINGAYGEADWTPIRYVNRAYSHSTLAGLYRAARVGRDPLRDGMNLIAKEYVASQIPTIRACLSSRVSLAQLKNAKRRCWSILTIRTVSRRLLDRRSRCRWLQRRERHDALFRVLSHNDIQHWADRFLAALEREPTALSQLEQMPSGNRNIVVSPAFFLQILAEANHWKSQARRWWRRTCASPSQSQKNTTTVARSSSI